MTNSPDALALFSGGLDSILAAKLIESQHLKVKCLHFTSPFFGDAEKIQHWRDIYGLDIEGIDISAQFIAMLVNGPRHGFGKTLNPCIDCKILLLRQAKALLAKFGAKFLISGEVTGQRPMSQRKDTMNLISRDAGVRDLLLRPLCARYLPPIAAEESGLVDHAAMMGITGRGRSEQLALAEKFGLKEIPTPAGGCRLTEKENTRRYWRILKNWREKGDTSNLALEELRADMELAMFGRQVWHDVYWLAIGRNQRDNARLAQAMRKGDAILRLVAFPGPLALARGGREWPREMLQSAASLLSSFSPKAIAVNGPVRCAIQDGLNRACLDVVPCRQEEFWQTPGWEETMKELREIRKPIPGKAPEIIPWH